MITLPERQQILNWIAEAQAAGARRRPACALLGITPRTLQRWQQAGTLTADARTTRTFVPRNKLSAPERERLIAVANTAEFADLPPSQIVPRLADRGEYLASESTFYRVLGAAGQLRHRQASGPAIAKKPRPLVARAPNQVYSWDITYLPTTLQGCFFYLYLFMDIYSRKIVGWQVYAQESSDFAADILRDIAQREGIRAEQVTLHSDNGSPMKGAILLATLQTLGILPSFSRPGVSNDNPYSEALFKTLKYRPEYPSRPFTDLAAARWWVARFVDWYNHEHRHSALRFVTPAQRHAGLDTALLAQRETVYQAAQQRHPERWSQTTRNWEPVQAVYLNPNQSGEQDDPNTLDQAA